MRGYGFAVVWSEWASAGPSVGVAEPPPAKEEDVSPAPAIGSSPQAEVRKLEKRQGGHRQEG